MAVPANTKTAIARTVIVFALIGLLIYSEFAILDCSKALLLLSLVESLFSVCIRPLPQHSVVVLQPVQRHKSKVNEIDYAVAVYVSRNDSLAGRLAEV
jgi:hypothetical protein